jgi:hypothetical protein
MSYAHYPLETQEDEFVIDLAEENIAGSISTELRLTPFLNAMIHNDAEYRTDYIDIRGQSDAYGGQGYERFSNEIGVDLDWLMTKKQNLALSVERGDEMPRDEEYLDQENTSYYGSLAYEYEVLPGIVVGARAASLQTLYTSTNRQDTILNDYSVFLGGERGLGVKLTEFTTVSARLGVAHGADWEESLTGDPVSEATATGTASLYTDLSKHFSHSVTYVRGLRTGFVSEFEVFSSVDYRIQWAGEVASASVQSSLTGVDPSGEDPSDYSDWSTTAQLNYPVVPYMTLVFSTTYDVRDNSEQVPVAQDTDEEASDSGDGVEQASVSLPTDIEEGNDYGTWSSRVGTSFAVLENLDFSVYAQHVVRISDSEDLEYERDTISATLTYSHEF